MPLVLVSVGILGAFSVLGAQLGVIGAFGVLGVVGIHGIYLWYSRCPC